MLGIEQGNEPIFKSAAVTELALERRAGPADGHALSQGRIGSGVAVPTSP